MGSLCKAITLFSFLIASNSFADANWPNEPVNSTVIVDCNFNSVECGGSLIDYYKSGQIIQDSSAPLSRSSVLMTSLDHTSGVGGIQLSNANPRPYKEMYVGLWWKTNPEFNGNVVGLNKLFFIRDLNGTSSGSNGFFGARATGDPSVFQITFNHNSGNLDNSHTCALDLGLACYPNAGPATIQVGTWNRIEAYIKGSTTTSSRDGVVRWWVNGQLAGNYTNINYSSNLSEWVWAETWDGYGNGKGFNVDAHHYIDHVRVSIPNGGNIPIPMPQPAPAPVPAPAPAPSVGTVSDLAVVSSTSSSVNLSFTEVADGSGAPAKYDLRVGPPGSQWGTMNSIGSGNCAAPIAGSQVGAKKTCTISGLLPSTQYQFQIVAYSGVINQGASYGGLSSVVSVTTQAGSPSPAPAPAPQPAPVPAPGPAPTPNPGSADSVAPQASFLYPTSGATLTSSVLLLAQASDNVGVAELRFYINGVQLGSELKQAPYAMVVDTTKIQDGNHELAIVAKDAAGNMSAPSKIRINVLNSGSSVGSSPILGAAGCMQTQTNQVNASMGLIWVLPLAGLMRRRKKGLR